MLRNAFHFFNTRRFATFLIFSGLAALSNIASGYAFYDVFGFSEGWRYSVSVALAFLIGMAVSFTLNRRYTFERSGRRWHQEAQTFVLVSVIGLLLTVALAYGFRATVVPPALQAWREATGHDLNRHLELLSHVLAVGLVAFYSFAAHRLLTFDKGIRDFASRTREDLAAARRGGTRDLP